MEFDRSQIFAPVKEDTVPRFAQRPRPAAPGLLDQLPSTNIGRTKNNDRLRILVRGVPDHATTEDVEKHLIKPFDDLVDSWYLVRQDFVADLDLDLDPENAKGCTRVYVQLHNREGVQKFHAKVNGSFDIAQNWREKSGETNGTETISDSIPTPLQVEYSPLPYFTPDPITSDIMAGTIESDPLYLKFCENPDQLLFEGGEGRVLEPVIAPTEFEVDSIVPVGVPLAKIDIPEDERVTLPEEKKNNKKKAKKGKEKKEKEKEKEKEKRAEKADDTKQDSKQKEKESPSETTVEAADATREGTPSEDKKKKRSRKKKSTPSASSGTEPPASAGTTRGATGTTPSSNSESPVPSVTPSAAATAGTSSNNSTATPPTQGKPKTKKRRPRDPKDAKDSVRESPTPRESSQESPAPRESRESTPKEARDGGQGARKPKKKSDKPKKDTKTEVKADTKSESRPRQQPGKENHQKPKPKPQPQSQPAVSVPQTTGQIAGSQTGGEKAAPKKKRTRTKKVAANPASTSNAGASSSPGA